MTNKQNLDSLHTFSQCTNILQNIKALGWRQTMYLIDGQTVITVWKKSFLLTMHLFISINIILNKYKLQLHINFKKEVSTNTLVWRSMIFCVTSLGTSKAEPPPVWLRLLLFTSTINLAVEHDFVYFSLIWSTDLFCPTALTFTESVISFHTFSFSAFVMTLVCFDLNMVMFFSTSSHKKTKSALEKCSPFRLISILQTISDILVSLTNG